MTTELTERQMIALSHPVADDVDELVRGILHPMHPSTKRRVGNWLSILEVRRLANGKWHWVGSVSRRTLTSSRPIVLAKWRPGWLEEAKAILRGLLVGVGDEEIVLPFAGPELLAFRSLQRWRSLTAQEEVIAEHNLLRGAPS